MFSKILNKPILVLTLIILLLIISIPIQKKIDKQRNKFRSIEQTLFLNSNLLKKVSRAF